jgi:molybdopterin synthase catalytic subunit
VRSAVTSEAIDVTAIIGTAGSPADGAVVLFVGTVREQNAGQPVRGMRYEAYAEMASEVLRAIVAEAAELAGTDRITAVHRTGELEIGDVSVAIAVATPHRAAAFAAARYIIEEIKVRLPVWKREHYVTGASQWVEGVTPVSGNE